MKRILLCLTAIFGLLGIAGASPDTKLLRRNAGSPDLSPAGNRQLLFHTRGADGYYDIQVARADGSRARDLTRDHPGLPNRHTGEPIWHPSGEWIAFKAEKREHVAANVGALAVPAIGFHNDVWVMSRDGKRVFQLTDLPTRARVGDRNPVSAVLNPHFSDDGKLLSWSERVGEGGNWGRWVIRVADFEVLSGRPRLGRIRTYTPGANQQYYESNDFLADGRLLICGNLEPGQDELGIDIYILDLETGATERLTHSKDIFDECPHVSPDGKRIAFLSTRGYPRKETAAWWNWAKAEIWVMDIDGSNPRRVTGFNRRGGNRVLPAKIAWTEDGRQLLIGVAVQEAPLRITDRLYRVKLD